MKLYKNVLKLYVRVIIDSVFQVKSLVQKDREMQFGIGGWEGSRKERKKRENV